MRGASVLVGSRMPSSYLLRTGRRIALVDAVAAAAAQCGRCSALGLRSCSYHKVAAANFGCLVKISAAAAQVAPLRFSVKKTHFLDIYCEFSGYSPKVFIKVRFW